MGAGNDSSVGRWSEVVEEKQRREPGIRRRLRDYERLILPKTDY